MSLLTSVATTLSLFHYTFPTVHCVHQYTQNYGTKLFPIFLLSAGEKKRHGERGGNKTKMMVVLFQKVTVYFCKVVSVVAAPWIE